MPADRSSKESSEARKPYILTRPHKPSYPGVNIDLSEEEPWSPDMMPRAKFLEGQSSKRALPMATPEDHANPDVIVVQELPNQVLFDQVQKKKAEIAEYKQRCWAAEQNWQIQKEARIRLTAKAEKKYKDLKSTIDTGNVMDANKLNDIHECPLCLETLDAPWSLRCGHTFCYKCLRDWFRETQKKYIAANPERSCKYDERKASLNSISFRCPINVEHRRECVKESPAPAYLIKKACDMARASKDEDFVADEVYNDPIGAWNEFFVSYD